MNHHGLFIGLATLDVIYLISEIPQTNDKIVASDHSIAAGGPATNAAVTFSYLGNQATWLGVIGQHPLGNLIKTDLEPYHLSIIDLEPEQLETPPTSSILVTQTTGDRAVISLNATKIQADPAKIPLHILDQVDLILIDGHQLAVSSAIAPQAAAQNIPIVLDGGSWKPGLELVLPYITYAICSANFIPPYCNNQEDIFKFLQNYGIAYIAITQGAKEIEYLSQGTTGTIKVPQIQAVDTLGAGDIFHGAFCHYILQQDFVSSLEAAGAIASHSCRFFGTRQWML